MAGRRKGIIAGLVSALGSMLLGAPAAVADQPMTFEWGTVFGDVPAIFADGEFTPENPCRPASLPEAVEPGDA